MDGLVIQPLSESSRTEAAELLGTLNPEIPAQVISERLATITARHPHYQIVGAFVEGRLAGVAGAWIATKVWCGLYLEIDNLVVAPSQRGHGIGSRLIIHFEEVARQAGCNVMVLDSYTSNHPSHRLYHRLGFEIWGFHFIKPVGDWSGGGI